MTGAQGAAPAREPGQPSALRAALMKYCVMGLLLTAVLIPGSGRVRWTRAWLYAVLTVGTQVAFGIALHRNNPELLVERSRVQKGTKSWDKVLAPAVALVGTLAIWSTAAWDVRLHWPPPVPVEASAAAFAICIPSMLFTGWAMMTNRFFSATVRIQSERGHVVVDGGPYRFVRHPGYTGAGAFTLASPIALGSWVALIPAVLTVAVLMLRTALEDRTLQAELAGYKDYAGKVRKRLAPGIW